MQFINIKLNHCTFLLILYSQFTNLFTIPKFSMKFIPNSFYYPKITSISFPRFYWGNRGNVELPFPTSFMFLSTPPSSSHSTKPLPSTSNNYSACIYLLLSLQIKRRAAISTCIQLPERKPVEFRPFNPNSTKSINPKIIPWINTIPPMCPKSGNFFRSRGKVSTFPLFITMMSTIYTPNISLTLTLGTYKLHPSLLITLQLIQK